MFNATFNDISVILWQTDLLVEETIENHRPAISHYFILNIFYCQTNKQTIDQTQVIILVSLLHVSDNFFLSHNIVWSTPGHERDSNSQLQW